MIAGGADPETADEARAPPTGDGARTLTLGRGVRRQPARETIGQSTMNPAGPNGAPPGPVIRPFATSPSTSSQSRWTGPAGPAQAAGWTSHSGL